MATLFTILAAIQIGAACFLILSAILVPLPKRTTRMTVLRLLIAGLGIFILGYIFHLLPASYFYESGNVRICLSGRMDNHVCFWSDVWLLGLASLASGGFFCGFSIKKPTIKRNVIAASAVTFLAAIAYLIVSYDPGKVTIEEKEQFAAGIAKCWAVEKGSAKTPVVHLSVHMNQDANIDSIQVAENEKSRYAGDMEYKAAADHAMEALKACSPLKFLPATKYEEWKDMELTFDPQILP